MTETDKISLVEPERSAPPRPQVAGVILAGGLSRRFGGREKAFADLAGQPLIRRTMDRARPQVERLIISTNGDPSRFEGFGASIIVDGLAGHRGPLAGLETSLSWLAKNEPGIEWVATFPVDGPFFPEDLVTVLLSVAVPRGVPAIAEGGGRVHPVFAVWPKAVFHDLREFLNTDGRGRLLDFVAFQNGVRVPFPDRIPAPFFNINNLEDLRLAETFF